MTFSKDIPLRLLPSLSLVVLAVFCAPRVAAQTQPANETRILVTAIDREQHFVDTLRAEDLRILENGAPQRIISFQQITDQSASVAILIDASASQERTLPAQKLAATSFVDAIIRPARDTAAVATFTGTLTVQQPLTNDAALLRQAIARAQFVPPPGYVPGGYVIGPPPPLKRTPAALASYTAVWDAVMTACDQLFLQSGQTRRAIILLTDGEDTISKSKLSGAVDGAIRAHVVVYSIGIGDTFPFGIDKDALRKLSERTGGRAFFPKKSVELQTIFAEIGQELRTQYLIAYNPANKASASRKIQIEIVNPALRNRDIQLAYQRLAY